VPRRADAVSDNGFAIYAYFLGEQPLPPEVQAARSWRFLIDHPKEYFDTAGLFQPHRVHQQ
jgi:hypothetical protein